MCAAHGVHVSTCLHTEVFRRSAPAHANLFSTSLSTHLQFHNNRNPRIFHAQYIYLLGLRCALLDSHGLFFPKVTPQKQEPSDPASFHLLCLTCVDFIVDVQLQIWSLPLSMIRRTPTPQCQCHPHHHRVRRWWCIGGSILRVLEVSTTFTLSGQMTDLRTMHSQNI